MNSNMSTRYPKTTNNGGPQMIVQIPPIASNLALPDRLMHPCTKSFSTSSCVTMKIKISPLSRDNPFV